MANIAFAVAAVALLIVAALLSSSSFTELLLGTRGLDAKPPRRLQRAPPRAAEQAEKPMFEETLVDPDSDMLVTPSALARADSGDDDPFAGALLEARMDRPAQDDDEDEDNTGLPAGSWASLAGDLPSAPSRRQRDADSDDGH
jgi:hypothetical protein